MNNGKNSPSVCEFMCNKTINVFRRSYSNIFLCIVNITPPTSAWRSNDECNGVRVAIGCQDLNLDLASKLPLRDVVPEISAEDLKASNSQRLIKVFVALASELCIYFSAHHAFWQRQATSNKNKQIALGSQGDQCARVRTTLGDPLWKQRGHTRPKLNSVTNHAQLIYPLRRELGDRNLPETSNQRFEVTGTMMLEILSHPRELVLRLYKAVGQKPYGLCPLVSLHSHQLEQAPLPLLLRQFEVPDRKIPRCHDRDDRTNRLDPISSTTPFTGNTPGACNHADQTNKWDSKCQKDRTLLKGLSPLGSCFFPFRCFTHARSPGISVIEAGVSMGAGA